MARLTIIIRADGSKKIGMGHIFPMITLAQELERKHFNVVFITFSDSKTLEVLKKNHLSFKTISHPKNFKEIKKIILELKPRLIINNTWQNESQEHFATLKSTGSQVVGFYQIELGLSECNVVINPLPSVFIANKKKIKAVYYEGPEYIIFNRDAQEIGKKGKKINGQIKNVVLAIGGTDSYNLSHRINKLLTQILPFVKITTVAGSLTQLELFQLVHRADLAITAGGNTIFEFAFLGTPIIALAQEFWEEKTTRYVENRGAAIYSGVRDATLDNIPKILKELTVEKRRDMSLSGKKLVDGKGLNRIIAIIEDLV